MQYISTRYLTLLVGMFAAASVSATELNRYGEAASPVLAAGEWWLGESQPATPDVAPMGALVQVRGTVLSTFRTREDLYLNFGEDYKTDFTVRIPKRAWKLFGELEGKDITVRGVLRSYNGPMITVDRKEQLYEN